MGNSQTKSTQQQLTSDSVISDMKNSIYKSPHGVQRRQLLVRSESGLEGFFDHSDELAFFELEPETKWCIFKNGMYSREDSEDSSFGLPYEQKVLSDGSRYAGEIDGVVPHGHGCLAKTDGSFCIGVFEFGELTGHGAMYTAGGDYFEGVFKKGIILKGRVRRMDNTTYEGEFLDFKPQGNGNLLLSDGTKLTGIFEEGSFQGRFSPKPSFRPITKDLHL